jgi:sn-glycerol 3-phosphate transport system substrate-binding protein
MSWAQLESFSAWHNTSYASKNNGFGGLDARLEFNSPLHVRHFENLSNMSKQGLFVYKGRASKPITSFTSGECAMFIGSSGSYASVKRDAKFKFAESALPYYPDVQGAPQNTIVGGASLWVMSGKPAASYKGVAAFFTFLSSPKVQSESHMRTGYLPITTAAYELTEKAGFYKENPGTDVAVNQMIKKTTDKSRGVRLGNLPQIRAIEDEETELIWTGKKTPKEALDSAVKRGNELLVKFQAANK